MRVAVGLRDMEAETERERETMPGRTGRRL